MISPPLLKPGDKIAIVAPGRKVNAQVIEPSKKIFTSWGIEVVNAPHLFSEAHAYLSGSDDERFFDLQHMLNDPEITAIVCARGGYGTTRILDRLDFSSLQKHPKWIIGFSDVTALHLKLINLGIKSIHGTMPILFDSIDSNSSIESLRHSLLGESLVISAPLNQSNKPGKATAQILGGNLSLVVDAIGTSCDPDTTGKILVLEEIDEYSYKVDRMLMHLKRAGKLDNLAGLVVGHMTDIKEPELSFGEPIEKIVLDKIVGKNYPVAFNFPIGHENPNIAWVHGSVMTLDVTKTGAHLQPVF